MITHKRSGILIFKFTLWKLFRYLINFAGVTRQNLVSKGIMILLRRSLFYWLFVKLHIKIEIRSWNFFHAPALVYNQYFPVTTTWLSIKVVMQPLGSFFYVPARQLVRAIFYWYLQLFWFFMNELFSYKKRLIFFFFFWYNNG